MITLEKVCQFVPSVSFEDIGRAHKCIADGTTYYLVENSRGDLDEDGETIEYRVSWTKETKFTCTCYAGKEGFIHCKKGFCQHVLIAVACAIEEKKAMSAMAQAQAVEALKEVEQVVKVVKPLTKTEKAFYANEEKRQQEQASFLLALPSRNYK